MLELELEVHLAGLGDAERRLLGRLRALPPARSEGEGEGKDFL